MFRSRVIHCAERNYCNCREIIMAKFAIEMSPKNLRNVIPRLASIAGWSAWKHRTVNLKSECSRIPTWDTYLWERHGLELTFDQVHQYYCNTGRYPWPPRSAEEYQLYAFAAGAVGIFGQLSTGAKSRFAGAMRSGLEKEFGLGPLAFEVKTSVHFVSRGFDIDFHDLETGGGFDFLVSKQNSKLEIECKHLSADIGRQIHRRKLQSLSGVLFQTLVRFKESDRRVRLLRLSLPGRLSGNQEDQKSLVDKLVSVLSGEAGSVHDEQCEITSQFFPIESSPFTAEQGHNLTRETVQSYLSDEVGIELPHIITHWRPGECATIVSVESKKKDRVLDSIFDKLKRDAKKQFSEKIPALLCVYLADITEDQLLRIAGDEKAGKPTGLQILASALLNKRPHLHSVALITEGSVKEIQSAIGKHSTKSTQEIGPAYYFRNSDHPMAEDVNLQNIFA